jgi:hypothetical protein
VENKILRREISFKQFEVDALIDDVAPVLPEILEGRTARKPKRTRQVLLKHGAA